MTPASEMLEEMMGTFTGKDGKEYRCNKCHYPMGVILVKTMVEARKKMFFCKRKECERYGLVTMVAIVK
jgi:hypothetical protein